MRSIQELMSLEGRTAIVTGGCGHIGYAISEALVEAGANVALVDRSLEDLKEKVDMLAAKEISRAYAFELDLAQEIQVRALPEKIVEIFGGIDVLVNCAAFVGTTKLDGWSVPFSEQKSEAWRAAFEVNVTAVFELTQATLPWLKESGNGSIINVSSLYGVLGPDWRLYEGTSMGNPAAYGASKGALNQLTRWLATTLAPEVRCNVISPGGVWRDQPDIFVEKYIERTPLQRMAIEEDFKGIALFLASDLSKYVTGQNIIIDGGWSAW